METKASWLRSEIEKLEGMKKYDPDGYGSRNFGYNEALDDIITWYTEELKVLESK